MCVLRGVFLHYFHYQNQKISLAATIYNWFPMEFEKNLVFLMLLPLISIISGLMHVLLVLNTVPNAGFAAQIGDVDSQCQGKTLCPCLVIVSFIFNQIEDCQEFRHLLSNADKTLQLIPRWGGVELKLGVFPDVMRMDSLWCHTWKDSHSVVCL